MGKLFDRPTIPITRVEIHLGIDAGWIQTKNPFHTAEMFKDLSPVHQGELSQAGERVAYRDLILRLTVLLSQVQFTQGFAARALQPGPDRR